MAQFPAKISNSCIMVNANTKNKLPKDRKVKQVYIKQTKSTTYR